MQKLHVVRVFHPDFQVVISISSQYFMKITLLQYTSNKLSIYFDDFEKQIHCLTCISVNIFTFTLVCFAVNSSPDPRQPLMFLVAVGQLYLFQNVDICFCISWTTTLEWDAMSHPASIFVIFIALRYDSHPAICTYLNGEIFEYLHMYLSVKLS